MKRKPSDPVRYWGCILLLLSILGCGGSSGQQKKNPSSEEFPHIETPKGTLNYNSPVDQKRSYSNNIEGVWKIAEYSTQRQEPEVQFFKELFDDGHLMSLHFKNTEGGPRTDQVEFNLSLKNLKSECSLTLLYSIDYCCARMRRLIFTKLLNSKESTPSCIQENLSQSVQDVTKSISSAIEQMGSPSTIEDTDFQFTFHESYLTLQGSFQTADVLDFDKTLLSEFKLTSMPESAQ